MVSSVILFFMPIEKQEAQESESLQLELTSAIRWSGFPMTEHGHLLILFAGSAQDVNVTKVSEDHDVDNE